MTYRNDSRSPDYWQASFGVFSSGEETSFDNYFTNPFVIGQIEAGGNYLLGMNGIYRVYAWTRGRAAPFSNEFDASCERHGGWGVSVNQQVGEHVAMFGRWSHSFEGNVHFDQALTLGTELGGAYWGREHDRVGLAARWFETSKSFRAAAPGLGADGDDTTDFG